MHDRRCPAAHLAEKTIRINIARILATFHICPPLDGKGSEYMPDVAWNKDVIRYAFFLVVQSIAVCSHVVLKLLSHPTRFDCRIIPRSDTAIRLIRQGLCDVDA